VKIAFLTTEAVPFAKTGGLADVGGALPAELARRGHDVAVIMPAFRAIHQTDQPIETLDQHLLVKIADRQVTAGVLRSQLPGSSVPVYFVDQPKYYDRPGLYGDQRGDFRDNCERFVFFSRAALQLIDRLGSPPQVVHCNDWPTGLVPVYLKQNLDGYSWAQQVVSLMTIHNLGYQGQFWHWDMLLTGLPWDLFNMEQLEFYGHLNLLKAGIVFADRISTVSPRYSEEIQTPAHGHGLDGVLRARRGAITGIANGIDDLHWNPATDPHLAKRYDQADWQTGKAACKSALQRECGLPDEPRVPLIGVIGRLAEQKGWDLIIDLMRQWLSDQRQIQWAILGTGDHRYVEQLQHLQSEHADRLGLHLTFSDGLAHRIEAGSDMFLMPSRYEPCGLNQLYSLRYGTVPIVNPTGGLADTVVPATPANLAAQAATGFWMDGYDLPGLANALQQALTMYHEQPGQWQQIVATGMAQDWSWSRSASQYEDLYRDLLQRQPSA
jgi:starch synthase